MLPQKYHVSVSNTLPEPLKCFMENESQRKFQGPSLGQRSGARTLFYPISIMLQSSTKDSGIIQLTKNAKTNNIAGHHLVSRCVISTPSGVQRVYRCPKSRVILTQKYVSVSNMLSQLLKCDIKKKTNINFRGQTGTDPLSPPLSCKVLGQGIYFTP